MVKRNQSQNYYIVKYLDHYLDLLESNFAILLKGPWGCGKTWFIKDYIDKKNKQLISSKKIICSNTFIYVSLYGVKNIVDIDKRLFLAMNPFFDRKGAKMVGHLLTGAAGIWNLDKLTKKMVGPEVMNMISECRGFDTKILVFDDLERCTIPLRELTGYINSFVEHQQMHVILVANEEKINKNNNESEVQNDWYHEKIIGKRLSIEANFEQVFDSIVQDIKNKNYKDFLTNRKELIHHLFTKSDSENLRLLKRIISEFKWFYDNIEEINELERKKNCRNKVSEELIKIFFALFFDINLKRLKAPEEINIFWNDPDELIQQYSILDMDDENESDKLKQTLKRYEEDTSLINIIDLANKSMFLYFNGSIPSQEFFNFEIRKSSLYTQMQVDSPSRLLTERIRNFEDDELDKEIDPLLNLIKEGLLKHPGDILLSLSRIILIKKWGIRNISNDEVIQLFKSCIDISSLDNEYFLFWNEQRHHRDVWRGFAIEFQDDPVFQEINKYLIEVCNQKTEEFLKEKGQDIPNQIKKDSTAIYKELEEDDISGHGLYKKPIFKYVNITDLIAIVKSINNKQKLDFHWFVLRRLDKGHIYLKDEIEFWRSFCEILLDEYNKLHKKRLSDHIINECCIDINKELDKIKKQLKSQ